MKTYVKFKKLNDLAKTPTRGSAAAAGYDIYAATDYDIIIDPHKTVMIGTGLAFEVPDGTFATFVARSGLSCKRHLAPANKFPVVDSDYRGEVIIALHNHSDEPQKIEAGERIVQMLLLPYYEMLFSEVNELSETDRGSGGFGSSGVK